jgi:hypothetical protein
MKLLGGLIVLFFIMFGFFCIWASCEGAVEMVTHGAETRDELIGNWFLIATGFLTGMMCFACAPVIINEM